MRPIRQTRTGTGVTPPVPLDHYRQPFNVGVAVVVTGTVTYTVEHTYDDVYAQNFNPSTAVWFPLAALTAQTTTKDAAYTSPVTAVRLNISAGTGSATMTLIQAGMAGE